MSSRRGKWSGNRGLDGETAPCSLLTIFDLSSHLDRPFDAPGYWTQIRMHLQNPFDGIVDVSRDSEFVLGMNPAQHQYFPLFLDFPRHLGDEIVRTHIYLARCQRAGKGAGESAAGGRNHIIDRGCVGLHL